jgi:hypothetical protein
LVHDRWSKCWQVKGVAWSRNGVRTLVDAWLRRRDPERWRKLAVVFTIDPGDRQSSFDPEKGGAISLYAKKGITDAFAVAFSVIQRRPESHWPEIVRQFARILGNKP